MQKLGAWLAEWGPVGAAFLAAVAVALHTRHLPALGPQELTIILCAAVWPAVALTIAAGSARRRLAGQLRNAGAIAALAAAGLVIAAFWAIQEGRLNPGVGIIAAAFVHAWIAAANVRMFPLAAAFVGLLTWGLLYGSLALLGSVPAFARIPALRPLATKAYTADMRIIQLEPECAVYDPELSYRLRPGACVFENVEFRTHYQINSLGVRDDEESLIAPRVALLGDSYTMGWGLEEEEAYPALLEQALGERVLNTGISSYGTARELLLLEKVDRSALETIVIQYCPNDDYENREYVDHANKLPIQSRQSYEGSVRYQVSTRRFHPLRVPYKLYETAWAEPAVQALHALGWPPPWTAEKLIIPRSQAATDFLTVLENSPVDLGGLKIVIFSLSWGVGEPGPFLTALRERIDALPAEDWRSRIRIVDVLPSLSEDELFPLDRHLNAGGHRIVARKLLPLLR